MAKSSQKSNQEIGSAFDLLGKSYEIVVKNWPAFAIVNVFTILSSIFAGLNIGDKNTSGFDNNYSSAFVPGADLSDRLALGIFVVVIFAVINIFLYIALIVLETRVSAGKRPTISEIFNETFNYGLRLIGLAILASIIIVVGLILLIVPGIIAIGRLAMSPYILVDKNVGIIEAMKLSNEMGKSYFGKIWAAIGVVILISLGAGLLSIFPVVGPIVGTLITIAFSLVIVLRYRQLVAIKAKQK